MTKPDEEIAKDGLTGATGAERLHLGRFHSSDIFSTASSESDVVLARYDISVNVSIVVPISD